MKKPSKIDLSLQQKKTKTSKEILNETPDKIDNDESKKSKNDHKITMNFNTLKDKKNKWS